GDRVGGVCRKLYVRAVLRTFGQHGDPGTHTECLGRRKFCRASIGIYVWGGCRPEAPGNGHRGDSCNGANTEYRCSPFRGTSFPQAAQCGFTAAGPFGASCVVFLGSFGGLGLLLVSHSPSVWCEPAWECPATRR